jgi:rod shape-determining protein MreD
MKSYLVLLPIFLFSLFQGAFLPLNLVLLVVVLLAVFRPAKESLWLAFISGLFLDLAVGTPLGFSSFLLLVTCGVLRIYSRRFDPRHPLFLAVLTGLVGSFWEGHFNWQEGLILGILACLLGLLLKSFLFFGEKKLKI